MKPLRAFISYAREYEVFARKFAVWLSDYGASIWIDVKHIPPGENWSTAIQEGLDQCDVLFVLITPEAMASKNVENEWQHFLDHEKRVIPILVKPAKVHFQLARLQYVDFFRQPFERAFGQLHTELRKLGFYLAPLAKTIVAAPIPKDQKPLPSGRPLRAFISYAREYEVFARKFAVWLSDYGALIWIDVKHIPPGENWSTAIQEGLDQCDVLFVLITPEAMASKNVENEWQYFLYQKKRVIPILVEPAKVHFQLARLQYVDFFRQPFERAFGQLHTELRKLGFYLAPLEKTIVAAPIPQNQKPLPSGYLQLIKQSRIALLLAPLAIALFIAMFSFQLPPTQEELSTTMQAGIAATLTTTYQSGNTLSYAPLVLPTAILPPTATLLPSSTAVEPTVAAFPTIAMSPISAELNKLPTDIPTLTQSPTSTLTQSPTSTLTQSPTSTLTQSPTPTLTQSPALPVCMLYAANNQSINVRSGPGTGFRVITRVESGEPCYILGDTGDGGWIHIQLIDGTQGWVYNALVDRNP